MDPAARGALAGPREAGGRTHPQDQGELLHALLPPDSACTIPPLPPTQSLQCKHSELVACLGEVETEREAISLSLEQCQQECSAAAKLAGEQAREIELLRQKLKAKEVNTTCILYMSHMQHINTDPT